VPPNQLARISFDADIDPGGGQELEIRLNDDEPISFSVEVSYSDVSGEQRTRTSVTVAGRRSYWRVIEVALYYADSEQPFVVLRREAEAVAHPE
jgi:hypothetical protein